MIKTIMRYSVRVELALRQFNGNGYSIPGRVQTGMKMNGNDD